MTCRAFADDDRGAADLDARDLAAAIVDADVQAARPAAPSRPAGTRSSRRDRAATKPCFAVKRRPDPPPIRWPDLRSRPVPSSRAVRRRIVLPALGARRRTGRAAGCRRRLNTRIHLRAIDRGGVHRLARRQRDDEEVRSAVDFLSAGRAGRGGFEADAPPPARDVSVDGLAERRLELRHPRERERPILPLEIDVGRPDAETEHRLRACPASTRRCARARTRCRSSGGRRTASPPCARRCGRDGRFPALRRKDERALGEIRLARHRLHRLGVEPRRLDEDEQLIALAARRSVNTSRCT